MEIKKEITSGDVTLKRKGIIDHVFAMALLLNFIIQLCFSKSIYKGALFFSYSS